jgi:hypothetical protein
MTQQANTPAAPAAAPADNGTGVSIGPSTATNDYESDFEARSASVFGNAPADDSQAADEAVAAAAPTPQADASAVASGDVDAARRERLAKLAELRKAETASVDAKAQKKQHEELQQRLAAAEKAREEAERMAQQRIDVSSLDERGFFEAAAKARVTPQRLAEWLKEQQANPELAASRAVETAIGPKLSPLEQRLAETEARLQTFLDAQQSERMQAEEDAAFHHIAQFTSANSVTSPRSAAFLQKFGPNEFRKLATSAAASVPPGAGPQAILDNIEENLAALAVIYAPQGAPAKTSIPQPNPAAAKAMTTVSNTLAQQRASVVDEDAEWASLPFEERSARLFR